MRLVFQEDLDYIKPVWPAEREQQQQMMHLDFYTHDLDGRQNTRRKNRPLALSKLHIQYCFII